MESEEKKIGGRCKIDEINKAMTQEQRHERAVKAGRSQKKKCDLRKCLEVLLENSAGRNAKGQKVSGAEGLSAALFKEAMGGDVRAFLAIRDTIGQKPVEQVMVAEVDADTIAEVERMVRDVAEPIGSD